MISLRKSAEELDRLKVVSDCYELALRSVAQYAIEIDPRDLAEFRAHLQSIEESWQRAESADALHHVQACFRGELRDYRDRAQDQVSRLRSEMEAAATALSGFAKSISCNGAEHEDRLKHEIAVLNRLADYGSMDEVRRGIHAATAAIASSMEQIRRDNQMVIAQLKDEIRLLHREVEAGRRALLTDRSSGAWTREKMDEQISELLRQNQAFCLLLARVLNLRRLESRHSRTLVEGALKALIRRFQTLLGSDALVGRWSSSDFGAITDPRNGGAIALTREVTRKLSGNYVVQENGVSHEVVLEVTAVSIDQDAGAGGAAFAKKLEQLSAALKRS